MALGPDDRPPSQITRNGQVFYPLGLRVGAGWHDKRGRQYTWDFRLICEGCGAIGNEAVLDDDDEYQLRGRVTTDSRYRTLCTNCRYQADVLQIDPMTHGAVTFG